MTNLLRDPWIPVRRASGVEERIAPWQVTEETSQGAVTSFAAPRPDFDGALAQFLVGLLQTAFAPEKAHQWRQHFLGPPAPGALREAFAPFESSFELFGDGPRFLQDLTLESEGAGEALAIERLLIEAPGENTFKLGKDHFVKAGRVEALCAPCAALALLTLQLNAPSGGQGHRTGLRGGGPLTTLVATGQTVWPTLWANVLLAEEFGFGNPERDRPEDRFPWLAPTRTSEKGTGRETTAEDVHLLQMYWGMPRRVRLNADDVEGACSVCGGQEGPFVRSYVTRNLGVNYVGSWPHPLTPQRRDKQGGLLPLHGDANGLSYRNWLGLVVDDAANGIARAKAVRLFLEQQRYEPPLRLWAFGYDMDNMKARAWLDAEIPLFALAPEHREPFEFESACLVLGARAAERALLFAIREAFAGRLADLGWDCGAFGARFWQESEGGFFEQLGRLQKAVEAGKDTEPLRRAWHRLLVRTANRVFNAATGSGSFDKVDPKRIAEAWHGLQRTLHGPKIREALALPRLPPEPAQPESETDDELAQEVLLPTA